MKKKLLAFMLVATMVLGMSTTAMAANTTGSFKKAYDGTATVVPSEKITFTVSGNGNNIPKLIVEECDVNSLTNNTVNFSVELNGATAGTYDYTIKEVAGNTQGVSYDTTTAIGVKVLVANRNTWDASTETYTTECYVEDVVLSTTKTNEDGKVDTITNTYDTGSLAITKDIAGNLASTEATFAIDVTLTREANKEVKSDITVSGGSDERNTITIVASEFESEASVTKTIYLKAGETVTISDIPAGMTYSVAEQSAHLLASGATVNPNSDIDKEYTVTYDYSDADNTIAADDTDTVEVLNTKNAGISTGIILTSMPYVVMIAIVAVALVAVMMRKRRNF